METKNQKWLVFAVLCLAYMPASYAQYQLSVFAPDLMADYGLTTSQFSSVFTSPMLVAIVLREGLSQTDSEQKKLPVLRLY